MNIVKKIYCRTFQSVMKAAIPFLPYRNPKILNSVESVPKVLKEAGKKRVLIVTDRLVNSLGLTSELKAALDKNEIFYAVYDKTVPNPTVSNVEEAKEVYLENKCDALIGFGGGSAMDCAKAVGARLARKNKEIPKMAGILKILRKIPFLIAVPTTAGTGSEVTVTTVITDEKTKHKYAISDFALIPDVAVHDPKITKTLPQMVTATTGMDALTHAVEAYIGRSTVKSTRKDALSAVKLISENLEKACENGDDSTARANMLKASFLAGRAFSKSYVGYCHAVAHTLGGQYNIAHGLANAVLLPYVLKAYGSAVYKKAKDLAIAMDVANCDTPEETACYALIEKIEQMNKNMGIPEKLSGIQKEDIDKLSEFAAKEANPLYPVPKLFSKEELKRFYYEVMEDWHE